jgi:hypothetical protein
MLNQLISQIAMKRVFVSTKSIAIMVMVIFAIMCAVPGCKSSKKAPAQRESTLDADKEKFRQDVFEKEMRNK